MSRAVRERLVRFYEHYAKEKLATVDLALKAYEGREDGMFRALERKYGPESAIPGYMPPGSQSPRKGSSPPRPARARTASPAQQDGGARAATEPQSIPNPAEPSAAQQEGQSQPTVLQFNPYRSRLVRFYKQYAPDKICNVDAALEAYRGKEDLMFRALERKYGPEPTDDLEEERPAWNANNVAAPPPNTTDEEAEEEGEEREESEEKEEGDEGRHTDKEGVDEEKDDIAKREEAAAAARLYDYDYSSALASIGVAAADIPGLLSLYGVGKEAYAGSVALLLKCIGDDFLFDVSRDTTGTLMPLHFPKETFPRRIPSAIDRMAFEHIQAYRAVFAEAWHKGLALRDEEQQSRKEMVERRRSTALQLTYHTLIHQKALQYIHPIQDECRDIIVRDEDLVRQGLLAWFRQRLAEIQAAHEQDDATKAAMGRIEGKWDRFRNVVSVLSACRKPANHGLDAGATPSRTSSVRWELPLPTRSRSSPEQQRSHSRGARSLRGASPSVEPPPSETAKRPTWRPGGASTTPSKCMPAQHGADTSKATATTQLRIYKEPQSVPHSQSRSRQAQSHSSSRTPPSSVASRVRVPLDKPLTSAFARRVAQKGVFSKLVVSASKA